MTYPENRTCFEHNKKEKLDKKVDAVKISELNYIVRGFIDDCPIVKKKPGIDDSTPGNLFRFVFIYFTSSN